MPGAAAAPSAGEASAPQGSCEPPQEEAAEEAAAASRELGARRGGGGAGSSLPAAVRGALELAEARRRLLEAEGRRQVVSELERRVEQLHCVFLAAELRLAHRAESLGRLGGGVAQAELYGQQRLQPRSLARRPKKPRPAALLASALGGCVPWAGRRGARGAAAEPPESPFKRSLQGAAPAEPPRSRP